MRGGGGSMVLRVIESEGLFESDQSEFGGESELSFFNLGFFSLLRGSDLLKVFYFFYNKPRAALYKTQLCMN